MARNPFIDKPIGQFFEDYAYGISHRFFNQFNSLILLVVFEVGLAFSRDPQLVNYNAVDTWFIIPVKYIQLGTLPFSILLIAYFGGNIVFDWLGIKTPGEIRSDGKERKRREQEGRRDWKPAPKGAFRPNLWYQLFIVAEGFVWGGLIYVLLQWGVFFLLKFLFGDFSIPPSIDAVGTLKHYLSNPLQDMSLAFGAGFYEEFVFRGLLFMGLVSLAGRVKFMQKLKSDMMPVEGVFLKIPAYNPKSNAFVNLLMIGLIIYVLSHYIVPFGDIPNVFTIVYRAFFGYAMYRIFASRGFSIVIWTHAWYDFLYFVFV